MNVKNCQNKTVFTAKIGKINEPNIINHLGQDVLDFINNNKSMIKDVENDCYTVSFDAFRSKKNGHNYLSLKVKKKPDKWYRLSDELRYKFRDYLIESDVFQTIKGMKSDFDIFFSKTK